MSEIEQQDSQMEEVVVRRPDTGELYEIFSPDAWPVVSHLHSGEILDAVVAGQISLEITPALLEQKSVLAPGSLLEAGKAGLATGGPVSNIGLALHKLGMPTRLMGKVGNDLFGQAIFQILSGYGADLTRGMVIAVDEMSSYSLILNPPGVGVGRMVVHAPGCNALFHADDVSYALLESTGLFHFGYPSFMSHLYAGYGEELKTIFERVRALHVTTSFDLSLSDLPAGAGKADWQLLLESTLPTVDLFLCDIESLLFILRRSLYEKFTAKSGKVDLIAQVTPDVIAECGRMLLAMGAKIVGIKLGGRGLYLTSAPLERLAAMGRAQPTRLAPWGNRELWAPCFVGNTVNEYGAGDAATAGFLMGILRGMSPEATLAAACAVSACSTEAENAIGGLRSWPATMERIAAGWSRLLPAKEGKKLAKALDMAHYQWRWNEGHELWNGPHDQAG